MSLIDRRTEEALAWAERTVQGTIVAKRPQARWRPHWFLDVERRGAAPLKLLMRGFRNPGYLDDEKNSRLRLKKEAGVIRCLQDTPVKVPRYYGFNEDLSWILMEWVQGTEMLTDVEDLTLRFDLFRQYMDNVAVLHTLDFGKLDVPPEMPPPKSHADNMAGKFNAYLGLYRSYRLDHPEPLLELGIQWLLHNVPTASRPVRFCSGDIGPNQFMFRDGKFLSMFDLEIAHLGDPLSDLGLMRLREMCYPIGRLPDHLCNWSKAAKEPLDLDVLNYWTMIGMVVSPMLFANAIQKPHPTLVDQMALYAFVPIHRRGIAESMLEIYGLDAEKPVLPKADITPFAPAHRLLVEHFHKKFIPESEDPAQRFFLAGSAAVAEHLALADAYGAALERETFEELSALLGYRPADRWAGLAALQELISRDYARDLEKRLRFFYRMEVRQEYLMAPIQRAMGFASNQPMTRMSERG